MSESPAQPPLLNYARSAQRPRRTLWRVALVVSVSAAVQAASPLLGRFGLHHVGPLTAGRVLWNEVPAFERAVIFISFAHPEYLLGGAAVLHAVAILIAVAALTGRLAWVRRIRIPYLCLAGSIALIAWVCFLRALHSLVHVPTSLGPVWFVDEPLDAFMPALLSLPPILIAAAILTGRTRNDGQASAAA